MKAIDLNKKPAYGLQTYLGPSHKGFMGEPTEYYVKSEVLKILSEKDAEIERLKKELAEAKG